MMTRNRQLGINIFWGLLIAAIIIILWKGVTRYAKQPATKGASTYTLQPADKGNVIVYGSKTCPWCVKQEDYLTDKGIPYEFVDCKTEQCPNFVQGFPTLMVDNVVRSGYTEI
jgi:glutaredoxin